MSAERSPHGATVPPPIDPYNVQEICADDILSIESGGGICTITFGKRRLVDQTPKQPKLERIVTCRLVLSVGAAEALIQQLSTIKRASIQHQTVMSAPAGVAN